MDGARSVYDLVMSVSAEYGELSVEEALKVMRDLEKTRFISFS